MKQNCWEYMKCGREPGGLKISSDGICPATTINNFNGFNKGKNAGRVCWAVTGTLCRNIVKGKNASQISSCMTCEFFKNVQKDEGAKFKLVTPVIEV